MQPDDVLNVVGELQARSLRVWIDGGEVTRSHDDVDLVVERQTLPEVFECLSSLEFSVSDDLSPVRVVLRSPDGRQIDLHPVTFADDGTGWQVGASPDGSDCPYPPEGFAVGQILDRAVPCLSAELQLAHHSGYPPRGRDRRDMALLASRFGLELPSPS